MIPKNTEIKEQEHTCKANEDAQLEALECTSPEEWDEEYTPSSTAGDYGPGNPWNAPGMSISDFI